MGRGHQQLAAIVALNILLGWTFLGWVADLVWSLSATGQAEGVTYLSGEGRPAPVNHEANFQARIGRLILWILAGAILLMAAGYVLR